jgi:hypothetical protein
MDNIRMKTLSAGPAGVRAPGSTHLLPPIEAKQLVEGGYAEYVEGKPLEKAVTPPPPPTTPVTPPAEKAVKTPPAGTKTATAPENPNQRKKR